MNNKSCTVTTMVARDEAHARKVEARLLKVKHALGDVDRANNRLRRVVAEARAEGAIWTEIGKAIGMTQQGAQKRFGSTGERVDAQEAIGAQRAAKRAAKKARRAPAEEPWPDGTVQPPLPG